MTRIFSRLQDEFGPYDELYERLGILWPSRPGRIVLQVLKLLSRPGRALDLGCGDGKHIIYLERLGWIVDGIDLSQSAQEAFLTRCQVVGRRQRGTFSRADVRRLPGADRLERYDLVIAYGLAHCLSKNSELVRLTSLAHKSLRLGGYLAFSAINDTLPLPAGHGTHGLRPWNHLVYLAHIQRKFHLSTIQVGRIQEAHQPVIGTHWHSVTWILAQKHQ